MANVTLIYCAGGNKRFAEIAIEAGFLYGARLPDTIYFSLYFADQNYKKPDREKYMASLEKHHPYLASVIDWEEEDQLPEVLDWAEEASQFVSEVMIIPKIHNSIWKLPRFVNNKPIRLGYSVPTKYGGTSVMINEFYDWPVHLLGGSPQNQVKIWRYLPDVISTDGNMAMKMATRFGAFFDPTYKGGKHTNWPTISDIDGQRWQGRNAPAEAFRRSCANITKLWREIK